MAVFISYSSRDKEAVDHIVGALKAAREEFWLDEELTGGERWWRKILKQIRESNAFIVAVSENSERSKPCHAELEYAIALGLPIIPVQIGALESVMTNRVGDLQMIDYRQPTPESAIAVSVAVREARERPTELPTPLPRTTGAIRIPDAVERHPETGSSDRESKKHCWPNCAEVSTSTATTRASVEASHGSYASCASITT